MSEDNQLRLNS